MAPDCLRRLLQPKSIAVIGGGFWCESVITANRQIGFEGDVWAVHPKKQVIAGCETFASVEALPAPPDIAFVGINREATIDVVGQLAKLGAGGAICFASGFAEAKAELEDAEDLQARLLVAAGDMPFLGPNCYGFLNLLDKAALWPDCQGAAVVDSGVAIIAQSSNIALNLTMQQRGLPLSYVLTVGNQASVSLSDLGHALLHDERVTAIGLMIEGIGDLHAFEQLARLADHMGKRLVVLKLGKSEQSRLAAVSHTVTMTGSSVGASVLFERLGIAEVSSPAAFVETLKIVHLTGGLTSRNVISLSCSGGEAGLMADMGQAAGLTFPPLTERQRTGLADVLGPKVALANPLDYHTYIWGDVAAIRAMVASATQSDAAICVIVLDFPRSDRCDQTSWFQVIEVVKLVAKETEMPLAVLASLAEALPEEICHDLVASGIIPLCGFTEALEAISVSSIDADGVDEEAVLPPKVIASTATLSEFEGKTLLARYGLQTPKGAVATSQEALSSIADELGFPLVLKAQGVNHKSDVGGVYLNIRTEQELLAAASEIPTDSFLVERMVEGSIAELLVGVMRDEAHGYVLTLGAGGVLTELMHDHASVLIPASRQSLEICLKKLRVFKVLNGYRGKPACSLDAILDALMKLQDLVLHENIVEAEINPLMCGADFAIAADALIKKGLH